MNKFKTQRLWALSLCLLMGFWCIQGWAQFHKAEMGLQQAGLEFGALRIVAKVIVPQPGGGTMSCSGAYISDRQHLLLASHCLERNVFGFKKESEDIAQQVEVDGRVANWKVRLISPCRREQIRSNPLNENLNPIVDCEYYDLAILEPQSPAVAPGCVSLNDVQSAATRLLTLGYPVRTFRPRETNSMGDGLYISFGQRVDATECKVTHSLDQQRIGQKISLQESIGQAKIENALQSSLDVVSGNSGGLVLDADSAAPFAVVSFASSEGDLDVRRERCESGTAFLTPLARLERAFQVYQGSINKHGRFADFKADAACEQRRQRLIR